MAPLFVGCSASTDPIAVVLSGLSVVLSEIRISVLRVGVKGSARRFGGEASAAENATLLAEHHREGKA
jgi:hypothetical protein